MAEGRHVAKIVIGHNLAQSDN